MIKAEYSPSVFDKNNDTTAVKALRNNFISQAEDLVVQVGRLVSNMDRDEGSKLHLLDNARYVASIAHQTLPQMADAEADFNLCIKNIKLAADAYQAKTYMSAAYKYLRSSQVNAADAIEVVTKNLTITYALMMHYLKDSNSDPIAIPRVPEQQPAPIKVEISNNHINLTHSQSYSGTLSPKSIEQLRVAIQQLLTRTIEQSSHSSNIDPRLAPNLQGLNTYLSFTMSEMPIEALGLNYQFARRSFVATKDTVPDAIAEQIDQVLSTVNVILNQFEEWRQYISAQTAHSLSPETLENVIESGKKVTAYLEINESYVEPKLIERLKEITDSYSSGLINIESAAVPLVESLGNLFSEISRFVISHSPVAENALAHPGAFVLFLGFTVRIIEIFTPTLSQFPPLSYLIDVQKFAHKQFSLLKDSISLR